MEQEHLQLLESKQGLRLPIVVWVATNYLKVKGNAMNYKEFVKCDNADLSRPRLKNKPSCRYTPRQRRAWGQRMSWLRMNRNHSDSPISGSVSLVYGTPFKRTGQALIELQEIERIKKSIQERSK
jgi:hypothetical protein